jgi:predicted AAA+ superfamily ATPase
MVKYVHREIEKELLAAAKEFPVVVLTGPRQTGKSTLLQKLFPKHAYFTFDDPLTKKMAKDDPVNFLQQEPMMVIDEIQYLPEILPFVKMAVDKDRHNNGRYILTGSQMFPLMAGLSESLAGRSALHELLGFSLNEASFFANGKVKDLFNIMFHGFFPEIAVHGADRKRFLSSYLQTYLERDIRQVTSVQDLKIFQNFLELLAARVGGLLNLNEIAKECGVSFTTARRWLSLLEATRMVYLLRPYHKNITKRIVKSPKLYFTDTGLLSFITRYPDFSTMQSGPMAGAFFENMIVAELLKMKFNYNLDYELYFYRDSNHNEVDIVLDYGLSAKLLEVKLTSTPQAQHLDVLNKIVNVIKNSCGYLLSFAPERRKVSDKIEMVFWRDILKLSYLINNSKDKV